jgi:RNA polymerase sigma-70 factor (ECF subfamily)
MRFRKGRGIHKISIDDAQVEAENQESHKIDSPEETAVRNEIVERMKKAFDRLPTEQREVILMKEYQGLRFHEIANVLGIPLSTAKSRMYLGLKALRKIMEE